MKNPDGKNSDSEPWFGAKCIFLHTRTQRAAEQFYEERVILVRANSFDEAIQKAEEEAKNYCQDLEGCSYTGYVNVFHIYDEQMGDGSEIYSLMRSSDLGIEEYLDHFFATGAERSQIYRE
jgi:hypothetical protein